jgi:hypothetical protein
MRSPLPEQPEDDSNLPMEGLRKEDTEREAIRSGQQEWRRVDGKLTTREVARTMHVALTSAARG